MATRTSLSHCTSPVSRRVVGSTYRLGVVAEYVRLQRDDNDTAPSMADAFGVSAAQWSRTVNRDKGGCE